MPAAVETLLRPYQATALPDTALLTSHLAELLIKNLADGQHEHLWTVAEAYGCTRSGFVNELTPEHVMHMVTEMRAVVRGYGYDFGESSEDDALAPLECAALNQANSCEGRPLSHLLAVVPQPEKATDLPGLMWHVLKHRLSFTRELCGGDDASATATPASSKAVRGRRAKTVASAKPEVLRALLTLISSLTPTARAEVHRLLLDRRCLV
ncbi:hypothetical protein ACHHYP_17145, partial [Achlya hypogyna]